ncbi:MAG: cytochrome-c peroxidase [Spirochaetes bacterium]|nr:cytochrome-c peroxidase [Spirochaetota bacterium]
MRYKNFGTVVVLILVFLEFSCKPSLRDSEWKPHATERMISWFRSLQYSGYKGTRPYILDFPAWFVNTNIGKPVLTHEAVELGRFLFYDKSLSSDSSVACANCHQQKHAFTDPQRFSTGVKGRVGRRNSMHLVNLLSDQRFFWDGRAASLEEQVLMPIQDYLEMDLPLDELLTRLAKHPIYPALFERAYNSKQITRKLVADALAQFLKSIISHSAPADYLRAVDVGKLKLHEIPPPLQKHWPVYQKSLGILNCGPCHTLADIHGQNMFEDTGLEAVSKDAGYYVVTGNEMDRGKFKVPSVRNWSVTAPYMHDGRFSTIELVIDHYRRGMIRKPNISPLYTHGGSQIITETLTDAQVASMIAVLELYTDEKMLTDSKYSNPF